MARLKPPRPDHPTDPDGLRVAARIAVLVAKTLKYPLRCMALLYRRVPVRRQDRVDHRDQRAKLRLRRRLLPPVPRRHREPADLRDRLPVQAKYPRCLPPALPLDKHKLPNSRINLHREHSRPSPIRKGQPYKWPVFTPPRSSIMPPLRGLLFHRRVHLCLVLVPQGTLAMLGVSFHSLSHFGYTPSAWSALSSVDSRKSSIYRHQTTKSLEKLVPVSDSCVEKIYIDEFFLITF